MIGVFFHAQGRSRIDPVAFPARSAQLGEDFRGVVTALGGDDDLAALELFDVEGVLQRGFVLGHRRGFAARVRCGEKQGLDQVKVFFLNHAVHQNRADHAAPADQTYQLAHFIALSKLNSSRPDCLTRLVWPGRAHDEPEPLALNGRRFGGDCTHTNSHCNGSEQVQGEQVVVEHGVRLYRISLYGPDGPGGVLARKPFALRRQVLSILFERTYQ